MDCQMGEWLYYNFATEIFTLRNFVADFICLKLNFCQKKQKNRFFSATLWGI